MTEFPIIVITGQTATGKTSVAVNVSLMLLDLYNIESVIINADSLQVYNCLKILCSHPDKDQLLKASHNLFAVLDPYSSCTLKVWYDLAIEIIKKAHRDKKIPILVGGTGFYLNSIINGIYEMPNISPQTKEEVENISSNITSIEFHNLLQKIDPISAAKIHPHDSYRIARAYEFALDTGMSISQYYSKSQLIMNSYKIFNILIAIDNTILKNNCITRIKNMMVNGVVEEIEQFEKLYPQENIAVKKAIGYRQFYKYISGKSDLKTAVQETEIATLQYAKRQKTWISSKLKDYFSLYEPNDIQRNNDLLDNLRSFLYGE